jgi:hypothetical protein
VSGFAATAVEALLLLGTSQTLVAHVVDGAKAIPKWIPLVPAIAYFLYRILWTNYCRISDLEDRVAQKQRREEVEKMFFMLGRAGNDLLLRLKAAPQQRARAIWAQEGYQWIADVRYEILGRISPIDAAAFDQAAEGIEERVDLSADGGIQTLHIEQMRAYMRKLMEISHPLFNIPAICLQSFLVSWTCTRW